MPESLSEFVQMRDEQGALSYVATISGAMKEAQEDPDIWKISWTDATTGERVRLVRSYPAGMNGRYVWVHSPLMPD